MTKVCVIGAGPSGITAIKNIIDEGVQVQAYDYNSDVGGNWIYSESESHSSVFETTHIISSKTLSQYEDFTFDDFEAGIPDYPSHDQLRRYFQAYAKHFNLYPAIQFNTLVKDCRRDEDDVSRRAAQAGEANRRGDVRPHDSRGATKPHRLCSLPPPISTDYRPPPLDIGTRPRRFPNDPQMMRVGSMERPQRSPADDPETARSRDYALTGPLYCTYDISAQMITMHS